MHVFLEKNLLLILCAITICGIMCKSSSHDEERYWKSYMFNKVAKVELNEDEDVKYFKDYDPFQRKGYTELFGDTLIYPFFAVSNLNESTVNLTYYFIDRKSEYLIKKTEDFFYSPRKIGENIWEEYIKIEDDRIIKITDRGEIFNQPDETPYMVQQIYKDTIYFCSLSCLTKDSTLLNHNSDHESIILKLEDLVKKTDLKITNCNDVNVNFYDQNRYLRTLHSRKIVNNRIAEEGNESLTGIVPKKHFEHWNEFY
jgi:hypothetical protein